MQTSTPHAAPTKAPDTIGFPLIEQMLREMAGGKGSPTYDRLVTKPRGKLAAFRQANGARSKKECDALELALKRIDDLLDLLRTAKITPAGKKA